MKVNGKTYTRNFLTHEQLLGGAKIQYQMSDTPNKQRGTQDSDRPILSRWNKKTMMPIVSLLQ